MKPTERMDDLMVALQDAFDGARGEIWTAMPGKVLAYDAANQTVKVQGLIQPQIYNPQTGAWSSVTLPPFGKVPIAFPSGGGFSLNFPLAEGDEGIVVFAKNCIDGWWQNGGVQPQIEVRQHDLSDGMFIPGVRSLKRLQSTAPSATLVELRADDGSIGMTMDKAAGKITLKAAIIELDGEVRGTGEIFRGFGGVDQVGLGTHKHPANNQPPTPGT